MHISALFTRTGNVVGFNYMPISSSTGYSDVFALKVGGSYLTPITVQGETLRCDFSTLSQKVLCYRSHELRITSFRIPSSNQ